MLSGEHRDSLVGEASLPPRVLAAVLRACGEHRPLRCSEKWRLKALGRDGQGARVQTHDGSVACRDEAFQMPAPLHLGKEAKLLMAKARLSRCA